MKKTEKDCKHCIAYNVDHCAAKECKGALTVLRPRKEKVADEHLRKFYEYTLSLFVEKTNKTAEVHNEIR